MRPELIVRPTIDAHAAADAAMQALEQLGRRRGIRSAHLCSHVCLYYKPVWAVREAGGRECDFVVDGHTGLAVRTLP